MEDPRQPWAQLAQNTLQDPLWSGSKCKRDRRLRPGLAHFPEREAQQGHVAESRVLLEDVSLALPTRRAMRTSGCDNNDNASHTTSNDCIH